MTEAKNTAADKDPEKKGKKRQSAIDEFGNQVEKIAIRTAESIKKVVDKALSSRNTVLTIRVNEQSNLKLNMLVDVGLFKSRSESAAFLIQEGIKKQEGLFEKIASKLEKIENIRNDLKRIVSEEFETQPERTKKKAKPRASGNES
ncbi:MAG: hypothetical protein JXB23_12640 [Candidatus Aminicenantes bacterium]|nr:hypothetical protein [Candidatus Aminicenantes bacterium]